jgi:hypothetical protein
VISLNFCAAVHPPVLNFCLFTRPPGETDVARRYRKAGRIDFTTPCLVALSCISVWRNEGLRESLALVSSPYAWSKRAEPSRRLAPSLADSTAASALTRRGAGRCLVPVLRALVIVGIFLEIVSGLTAGAGLPICFCQLVAISASQCAQHCRWVSRSMPPTLPSACGASRARRCGGKPAYRILRLN